MAAENLDTMYIELRVQACQMSAENIWMQGSLDVYVNSEKPYEDSDIVMANVLLESMEKAGTYFIFSCCCGMPDCSGWMKGIEVTHEEDVIVWDLLDHDKTFRFDRKRMEANIEEVTQEAKNYNAYFTDREIRYVGFGYNINPYA